MTKERWEQIKQVFDDALRYAPEERSRFLARVCGDDSSLRLEVESLLSGDSRPDHLLDHPAVARIASHFARPRSRTFQPGDMVSGRFKIVRFIGEGGMGEVYEADDLEFNEHVALKTIRPEISSDEKTLARFKQEVQLTRRVTHPNVCRTFDLAHYSIPSPDSEPTKVTYLTMEMLEGETLAERLRRGKMTEKEMLPVIRQMAKALDAAHSAGVVHRDFKPGNVILCKPSSSGMHEAPIRAVVTDFGLARSFSSGDDLSRSLTQSGLVIGTLAYMSPEQAEGKEVTAATDIYALGLVLYEMATGARPFSDSGPFGPVIQRLKERPASPRTLVPGLESRYESTILKCLEIDPARRFAGALEVSQALAGEDTVSSAGWLPPWFRGARRRTGLWLGGLWLGGIALILLAALGAWAYWKIQPRSHPPMLSRMVRFTTDQGLTWLPDVSPDGKRVAYSSDRAGDGILNIWVQDAAEGATPFQVTHERFHLVEPCFSPNGSEIAFSAGSGGGIYVASVRDGSRRILDSDGHNPRFSPDGSKILYWSGNWTGAAQLPSFHPTGKLYVIPAQGGAPQRLQERFADARYAIWLPDGHHILFQGALEAKGSVMESSDWWIADANQTNGTAIRTGAFAVMRKDSIDLFQNLPQWWNNSVIFSARLGESNNIFQIHLSPGTWRARGDPEQLTHGSGLEIDPSVSSTGRLFLTNWEIIANIWALPIGPGSAFPEKESSLKRLTTESAVDFRPSVSLDGKKIVFSRAWGKDRNLWLKDLATGKETPLTSSSVADPVISRDGAQVAYASEDQARHPIKILAVDTLVSKQACADCGTPLDWSWDGSALLYSLPQPQAIGLLELNSGRTTLMLKSANALGPVSVCPSDRCIVFAEWLDDTHSRLWLAPMHGPQLIGQSEWIPLTDGRFEDDKPRVSPDGRSVYFQSNRDGFSCLWVLQLTSTGHARGGPVRVLDLHRASFSTLPLSQSSRDMRVAVDKLVFNVMTNTGNLWTTELQPK